MRRAILQKRSPDNGSKAKVFPTGVVAAQPLHPKHLQRSTRTAGERFENLRNYALPARYSDSVRGACVPLHGVSSCSTYTRRSRNLNRSRSLLTICHTTSYSVRFVAYGLVYLRASELLLGNKKIATANTEHTKQGLYNSNTLLQSVQTRLSIPNFRFYDAF